MWLQKAGLLVKNDLETMWMKMVVFLSAVLLASTLGWELRKRRKHPPGPTSEHATSSVWSRNGKHCVARIDCKDWKKYTWSSTEGSVAYSSLAFAKCSSLLWICYQQFWLYIGITRDKTSDLSETLYKGGDCIQLAMVWCKGKCDWTWR